MKLNKIGTAVISLVIALSIFTLPVMAADNPEYLYDGIYEYNMYARGNTKPTNSNVVYLPDESGTFTYSFAKYKTQYSDFVISPQKSQSDIVVCIESTTIDHDVTIKLYQKSGTLVYTKEMTVLEGIETEFHIPFTYLKTQKGYYLKLSVEALSEAAGTVTVEGV